MWDHIVGIYQYSQFANFALVRRILNLNKKSKILNFKKLFFQINTRKFKRLTRTTNWNLTTNRSLQALGLYILLADNLANGFTSTDNWTPKLYPYQQSSFNILFFSFIDPMTMNVPPAFANLAKTRGTGTNGAVPATTMIVFAIGKNKTKFPLSRMLLVIANSSNYKC